MEAIKEAIEYFHKGGLVMWPLLLCSIIVVTIAIERYLYYKTADSVRCSVSTRAERLKASCALVVPSVQTSMVSLS